VCDSRAFAPHMADPELLDGDGEEVLREEINKRIGGVWL
jgi:hypothetical protein